MYVPFLFKLNNISDKVLVYPRPVYSNVLNNTKLFVLSQNQQTQTSQIKLLHNILRYISCLFQNFKHDCKRNHIMKFSE